MNPVMIKDWRVYRRDGNQFLTTARAAHTRKKKVFSAETLYNLTCMGIEKLIMAFLMSRGDLAENHTMHDLARALSSHLCGIDDLCRKLDYLDSFQEICDPDEVKLHTPDKYDVIRILSIGEDVQDLLAPHLDC
jgi:hypothetical protein